MFTGLYFRGIENLIGLLFDLTDLESILIPYLG